MNEEYYGRIREASQVHPIREEMQACMIEGTSSHLTELGTVLGLYKEGRVSDHSENIHVFAICIG